MVATLPDPGAASGLPELVEQLRALKRWAGDPSYESITGRINTAWTAAGRPASELTRRTTVADCFRTDRRRLSTELVVAIVEALHPDLGYVAQWRQALRVIGGEVHAAAQVRVRAELPGRFEAFSGRVNELEVLGTELPRALTGRPDEGGNLAVLVGMAGVGKTQLAVQTGYRLLEDCGIEQVLHVNLRGFHPDATQPPADPAAVLDGFLRLLGVPGGRIPPQLEARAKLYQEVLADRKALVLLDNATSEEQIRHLLPRTPGSVTMVTSRHSLVGLPARTRMRVNTFTPEESRRFLSTAVPEHELGADPKALERIAELCGHLPLALGLVAGHIGSVPGWTLTDHADRLAERHRNNRLDADIEIAFRTSYQSLTDTDRRLLRLAALIPGQDFDAYAIAALCDLDLPTTEAHLECLRRDHLLIAISPGRYTLHDLIRTCATTAATDEEPPRTRQAALTRLFDAYLFTALTAMNVIQPEGDDRPRVPAPSSPTAQLETIEQALDWLDTERPNLIAAADYCVRAGLSDFPIRLSAGLYRYLEEASTSDALAVFELAQDALREDTPPAIRGRVLTNLGSVHGTLSRHQDATTFLLGACEAYQLAGQPVGAGNALHLLGGIAIRTGDYQAAQRHVTTALDLFRQGNDVVGMAKVHQSLGIVAAQQERAEDALDHFREAERLSRAAGSQRMLVAALNNLGKIEAQLSRLDDATRHLTQALDLARAIAQRVSEGAVLEALGSVLNQAGDAKGAVECCRQSLDIHRELGHRYGQVWSLNGLGEALTADGRPMEALTSHHEAETLATEQSSPDQLTRARVGMGVAARMLGDLPAARTHYEAALAVSVEHGLAEEKRLQQVLAELGPVE